MGRLCGLYRARAVCRSPGGAPASAETIADVGSSDTLAGARRYHRGAIDFFLKTEMDKTMLDAFGDYKKGLKSANEFDTMDEFKSSNSADYDAVQIYLNTIELICIGINEKVFDQRVCYGFWMDVLTGHIYLYNLYTLRLCGARWASHGNNYRLTFQKVNRIFP